MAGAIVVDTHAIVWYLSEPERLSATALAAFDQAARSGVPIYVTHHHDGRTMLSG